MTKPFENKNIDTIPMIEQQKESQFLFSTTAKTTTLASVVKHRKIISPIFQFFVAKTKILNFDNYDNTNKPKNKAEAKKTGQRVDKCCQKFYYLIEMQNFNMRV